MDSDDYPRVITESLFTTVCCCFAALTWVTYDHCQWPRRIITFRDEVEYVWKRPTRAGSLMYYAVRYIGMLGLSSMIAIYLLPTLSDPILASTASGIVEYAIPPNRILNHVTTAFLFALFFVVEVILQIRIFALYSSKWLARVNAAVFVVEMILMNVLWVQYKPSNCSTGSGDHPALQECPSAPLYWVPGIAFEIWLSGLALAKLRPRLLHEDILSVMVHDSVKYFCLITSVTMAHIAMTVHGFGASWTPFVIASLTIGGSRIVLHLRQAYFRPPKGTTSLSRPTVSILGPQPESHSGLSRSLVDESFYAEGESGDIRTQTATVCEAA